MPEPDAADAGESQDAFDEAVRAKGERILAAGRQNVTSLQARAGSMGERDSRAYWRGLVRPIPHVASPAAQLGTRFHAWLSVSSWRMRTSTASAVRKVLRHGRAVACGTDRIDR